MDRNAVIGLTLIMLLTAGYLFFAPKPEPPTKTPPAQTTQVEPRTDNPALTQTPSASDSSAAQALFDKYSDWSKVVTGEDKTFTVTTDLLTVKINSRGGYLREVYLNEYDTYDSLPLPVIQAHNSNKLGFVFDYRNRAISSKDLFFTPLAQGDSFSVAGTDSLKLVFRARIDSTRYLDQVYTFRGGKYDVDYDIVFAGVQKEMVNSFFEMEWNSVLPRTELALENMRQKSFIAYRTGDDVEKMKITNETVEEKITSGISWISFKSQFFSAILLAKEPFRSGTMKMTTPVNNESINRVMNARTVVDIQKGPESRAGFMFYFGPNEYYTLTAYKQKFQQEMDLGWSFISYINIGTTYVFKFLEKYVGNYGLIIIILAFVIRMLILPMTYRSHVSMAKMRIINETPEMKELDVKHKDDPQKLQMAKMGIYKEMGVSMFGGCLPMLLSYPFLIALFFFFPQAVELRHQPFLWAHDLSTYDSILNLPFKIPFYGSHVSLFTLLMAASTWLYTYFQQQSQVMSNNAMAQQMKFISYSMPVVLLFFLNNYAAGLSLYYLFSNLLSIGQTIAIRQFVDDKKLLEKMHSFKNTNAKKGKPAKGRLESWVENQQKKQQELLKQRQQPANPVNNRRTRRTK